MVSVIGVLQATWDILASLVPMGVDPVYFWATFALLGTIIYYIVDKIPQFQGQNAAKFVIAVVFGYFAASSAFVTILISKFFPNVGLGLTAILGFLLVLALAAPKHLSGQGIPYGTLLGIIVFIAALLLTWYFAAPELAKAGYFIPGTNYAITDQDMAALVIIGIFGFIIYAAVKKPSQQGKSATEKFIDLLKKLK